MHHGSGTLDVFAEVAQCIVNSRVKNISQSSRATAVIKNPAVSDWFFYHCVQKFIEVFYVGILGAIDYWMRFEWQHRGSPHVHGLAWLPNAPDAKVFLSSNTSDTDKEIPNYFTRWKQRR